MKSQDENFSAWNCVPLVFDASKMVKTLNINNKYWPKQTFVKKACRFSEKQKTASPKRRKWGLGLPVNVKMTLVLFICRLLHKNGYELINLVGIQ